MYRDVPLARVPLFDQLAVALLLPGVVAHDAASHALVEVR